MKRKKSLRPARSVGKMRRVTIPPPRPKKKPARLVNFRLTEKEDADLARALALYAARYKGASNSDVIRAALKRFLEELEKEEIIARMARERAEQGNFDP